MLQLLNSTGHVDGADRVAIDSQAKAVRAGMFHRIANREMDAVNECVQTYGDLVWTIAKLEAQSAGGAEQLTQEIFACILRSAKKFDAKHLSESDFITVIARHCIREWELRDAGRAAGESSTLHS